MFSALGARHNNDARLGPILVKLIQNDTKQLLPIRLKRSTKIYKIQLEDKFGKKKKRSILQNIIVQLPRANCDNLTKKSTIKVYSTKHIIVQLPRANCCNFTKIKYY